MTSAAPTRLEQQKALKRDRIVRAALELFAERGFHGTAVPLVAERAGVGAGTIYRFFDSKDALVNEVFREAKGRLSRALLEELDISQPPKALFDTFWRRLVEFARGDPVTFHFLELQDHAPYLDAQSKQLELGVLGPIYLACAEFQEMGIFTKRIPPDAIMAFVWGAFVGLMKAERHGYLELDDETTIGTRDACWRAFATTDPPHNE